jgi:hypothetical protein
MADSIPQQAEGPRANYQALLGLQGFQATQYMSDHGDDATTVVTEYTKALPLERSSKTGRPPAAIRAHFEETGKLKNASTFLVLCKFCRKEVSGRAISLESHLRKCELVPDELRPSLDAREKKGHKVPLMKSVARVAAKRLCTAVASMEAKYKNLVVLKMNAVQSLHVMIRDKRSTHAQFVQYADRIMRYSNDRKYTL